MAYAKNMRAMVNDDLLPPKSGHDKEGYLSLIDAVIDEYTMQLFEKNTDKNKKYDKELKKQ